MSACTTGAMIIVRLWAARQYVINSLPSYAYCFFASSASRRVITNLIAVRILTFRSFPHRMRFAFSRLALFIAHITFQEHYVLRPK
jgi:hypothetical protein